MTSYFMAFALKSVSRRKRVAARIQQYAGAFAKSATQSPTTLYRSVKWLRWLTLICGRLRDAQLIEPHRHHRLRTAFSLTLRSSAQGVVSATCLKLSASCAGSCADAGTTPSMLAGASPAPATMRWHSETMKLADALPALPRTGSRREQTRTAFSNRPEKASGMSLLSRPGLQRRLVGRIAARRAFPGYWPKLAPRNRPQPIPSGA